MFAERAISITAHITALKETDAAHRVASHCCSHCMLASALYPRPGEGGRLRTPQKSRAAVWFRHSSQRSSLLLLPSASFRKRRISQRLVFRQLTARSAQKRLESRLLCVAVQHRASLAKRSVDTCLQCNPCRPISKNDKRASTFSLNLGTDSLSILLSNANRSGQGVGLRVLRHTTFLLDIYALDCVLYKFW